MTTDTKKMVERIPLEVFNNGKFELIDELVSPDFVDHFVQPGVPANRAGFKQMAIALKTAFPDLRYVVEDYLETGDRFVHRATGSGTMKGEFMGIAPTGKSVSMTGINLYRIECGHIVEGWSRVNVLDELNQIRGG